MLRCMIRASINGALLPAGTRNYHSTALLMRNGAVWHSGSNEDCNPGPEARDRTVKIYEPWYFCRARPVCYSTALTVFGRFSMKSEMSAMTKRFAPLLAPLKKREESAAINVARTYLSKQLSAHFWIFGAELRLEKPLEPRKAPVRMIGVLVVDYGNRRNVEVLVQPEGKVVRVDDLGTAQPSYTREEIAEARMIAEQDDRVRRLAKTKGVFASDFGPDRASDNARRIGIRYAALARGRSAGLLAHVVVDLSAGNSWHLRTRPLRQHRGDRHRVRGFPQRH